MTKRLTGNVIANAIIIIAVICVPLLYSGLLTWTYENPMERLNRIDAAVVNLDTPATAKLPDGKQKHLDLGAELTDRLTNKHSGENVGFDWHTASYEQAQAGLRDGKYLAVLTIPAGFSQDMSELSGPNADKAKPIKIDLQTNDGVNYLAGTMAQSVARELENIASAEGSTQYIDNVLVSISEVHKGMNAAADGAKKLQDGSKKLDKGTSALQNGTSTLVVGLSQLANGSVQLRNANGQIATGAAQLSDGASRLDVGAAALLAGMTKPAAPGSPSFVSGMDQLTASLNIGSNPTKNPTLRDATMQLVDGSAQLTHGVNKLAQQFEEAKEGEKPTLYSGLKELEKGGQKLGEKAPKLVNGVKTLTGQFAKGNDPEHPTLYDGANKLAAGATEANTGAQALASTLQKTTDGKNPTLADGTIAAADFMESIAKKCQEPFIRWDPLCIGIRINLKEQGLADDPQVLIDKAQQLKQGVNTAGAGAKKLAEGTAKLDAGANDLVAGINKAAAESKPLITGAEELGQGAAKLSAGINTLYTGIEAQRPEIQRLQKGTNTLNSGIIRTNEGVAKAGAAAKALDQGLNQRIVPGVRQLAGGTALLAEKSPQLAQGAQLAAAGANALANGALAANSGAQKLDKGAVELNKGANALNKGATTLSKALREGADQVPYYSDSAANAIATTAGHPIDVEHQRIYPAGKNGIGFAPFFMALALYVGAIAMFFVFPALDMRRAPWEKWWISAARVFGITTFLGILQAIAAGVGLQLLLGLDAKHFWTMLGVMALASICFVSMNQACVASLGYRGRFVSVVLLILQISSMGATFPIETAPKFLRDISPYFPMTHLAEGIRTNIVGGGLGLSHGVMVISIWMVASWIITIISAKRRRGAKPMPFDPALAFPGTEAAKATDQISVAVPVISHAASAHATTASGSGGTTASSPSASS